MKLNMDGSFNAELNQEASQQPDRLLRGSSARKEIPDTESTSTGAPTATNDMISGGFIEIGWTLRGTASRLQTWTPLAVTSRGGRQYDPRPGWCDLGNPVQMSTVLLFPKSPAPPLPTPPLPRRGQSLPAVKQEASREGSGKAKSSAEPSLGAGRAGLRTGTETLAATTSSGKGVADLAPPHPDPALPRQDLAIWQRMAGAAQRGGDGGRPLNAEAVGPARDLGSMADGKAGVARPAREATAVRGRATRAIDGGSRVAWATARRPMAGGAAGSGGRPAWCGEARLAVEMWPAMATRPTWSAEPREAQTATVGGRRGVWRSGGQGSE
uniref:Uncharacterized protein n=1 Tax=Oryza punctata TaxID=4537 RepID=A0A0E0JJU5_ORYPU